jgi:hypothetical protein
MSAPDVDATLDEMWRRFDEELVRAINRVDKLPDSAERARLLADLEPYTGRYDRDARRLRTEVREKYKSPGEAARLLQKMLDGVRAMGVEPPKRAKVAQRAPLDELERIRRRLAEQNRPHGIEGLAKEAGVARSTVQIRYKDERHPPGDPIPGVCDAKGSNHH